MEQVTLIVTCLWSHLVSSVGFSARGFLGWLWLGAGNTGRFYHASYQIRIREISPAVMAAPRYVCVHVFFQSHFMYGRHFDMCY